MLAPSLFLYSYGYGAITTFTAVYADATGIRPKSLYLTTLAIALLVTRRSWLRRQIASDITASSFRRSR